MKRLVAFWLSIMLFVTVNGQTNYAEAMLQGDSAFNRKEYKVAINKYFAAEAFDPNKKDSVKAKVNRAFEKIERLRSEAEKAKKEAIAEKNKAETANSATEKALYKANKLINAFYFYKDRFALAIGGEVYYQRFRFIDKNGDHVKKLGEWERAGQFEEVTGFAKVKDRDDRILVEYLLDTLGNKYPVAYDLEHVNYDVTALDLSATRMDSFPAEVLKYNQLKVLILNANINSSKNIKILPPEIGRLTKLEYLFLANCGLRSLPPQIGALKNLKVLVVGRNYLINLPPEINDLANLAHLDLRDTQLANLPGELGKMKLTMLDVGNNHLGNWPAQVGELKDLRSLSLDGNGLKSVPSEIGQLKHLTHLNLRSNQLVTLPE